VSVLALAVILAWMLLLALGVLVLLLYRQFGLVYLGSGQRVNLTGLGIGKHAPEHQRVTLEGVEREIDWTSAGPGRGTLVLFGGPRCPICAQLVPELNDAVDLWGSLVDFIFLERPLNAGESGKLSPPEGRRWSYGFSPDASIYRAFDVEVSPYGFLVDHRGVVLNKRIVNSLDHLAMLVEHSVDGATGMLGQLRQPEHVTNALAAAEKASHPLEPTMHVRAAERVDVGPVLGGSSREAEVEGD
jgi:methylamine dehydrogenase accessory protein MauD